MRDPLLERNNAYLAANRRAGDAAREETRTLNEAESVVSEIGKWCRLALFSTGILEDRSEGHDLSDLLAIPLEQSPLQPFELVRDADRRKTLQDGFTALLEDREHDQKGVAAWLFGRALANALVEELSSTSTSYRHLLPGIWNLVGSRELIHQAFGDALPKLLRGSPLARHAILAELEDQFYDINNNPGIGIFSNERQAFDTSVEKWRSSRSLVELWKARNYGSLVHYDVLGLVPFILPAGRSVVLELLDHFDFPHPIRQIFYYNTILHDRDEIVASLEKAPICSDDNRTWNYSLPAILLLEAAEHHSRELWRAACRVDRPDEVDSTAVEQTTATLSVWFETLGRIVMARPDGVFLGSWWLLLKTIDERAGRARGTDSRDQRADQLRHDDVIEWIALGLSKAGLTAEAVAALVDVPGSSDLGDISPVPPDSDETQKTSVRLGALSVMSVLDHMHGNASPDDVLPKLDQLEALLLLRDPAFEAEAILNPNSADLPANSCGFLFARTDKPAARWQRCWDLLAEQRRRIQHWRETKDGDALAPSLFLLAAGTSGIDWLMSPGHRRQEEARELWRVIFSGVRDC